MPPQAPWTVGVFDGGSAPRLEAAGSLVEPTPDAASSSGGGQPVDDEDEDEGTSRDAADGERDAPRPVVDLDNEIEELSTSVPEKGWRLGWGSATDGKELP